MKRSLYIVLLCLIAFLIQPVHTSYAALGNMLVEEMLKSGIIYYEEGDYERAIHEFSKVLIVDVDNETAYEYLEKLGLEHGIYGTGRTPISHIAKLSKNVTIQKEQMALLYDAKMEKEELNRILEADKEHLQEVINTKEAEKEQLNNQIKQMHVEAQYDRSLIEDFENNLAKKNEEIASLISDIGELNDNMLLKDDLIQQREDKVEELKAQRKQRDKLLKESENLWREDRLDYENIILSLEEQISQYQDQIDAVDMAKGQNISQLEKRLQDKRAELNDLKEQLALNEYQLVNTEEQIDSKERKIAALQNSLSNLEDELLTMRTRMSRQEIKVEEWEDEKDFYESKDAGRIKLIKRQDKVIAELKEKLVHARHQLISIETELTDEKEEKVSQLQIQLEELDSELQSKEFSLREKTKDFRLLEERLQDTKQRLGLVEEMMNKKDMQIKTLEDELTNAANEFDESNLK